MSGVDANTTRFLLRSYFANFSGNRLVVNQFHTRNVLLFEPLESTSLWTKIKNRQLGFAATCSLRYSGSACAAGRA